MERYDVIVIGGGAAGLMAAAGAGGVGRKIAVLEKMSRPGRKIMITGKGRCNFTNVKAWNEFCKHIHPKPNFLKPSFYNLNSEKMIEFLNVNGMESVVERGDRAFPASHLATDVVDTLVGAAEKAGADILCNKAVESVTTSKADGIISSESPNIISSEAGSTFTLKCTDGSTYSCSRLIICTGGLSYPKTGSTGDGYRWATELGHTIRPLFPSLTAIVPVNYKVNSKADRLNDGIDIFPPPGRGRGPLEEWEGVNGIISLSAVKGHIDRSTPLSDYGKLLCGNQLKNVSLSLIIDGNEAANEFGDLDFTDGGIEGPIGFKVSRKAVSAIINGSKVTALIDLKPAVDIEDLHKRIINLWEEICKDKRNSTKQYKDKFKVLLTKVMPMSLIPAFTKAHQNVDHKTLAKTLKKWKFEITGYVGYERCVITAGGVHCEEISQKTLESRLTPGLYFAGEILDLDADTGGYNLQTAFSTGYLAGLSAARSLAK
jgi:predicted flavoprotein YhiN